jgi:hypothetical protein
MRMVAVRSDPLVLGHGQQWHASARDGKAMLVPHTNKETIAFAYACTLDHVSVGAGPSMGTWEGRYIQRRSNYESVARSSHCRLASFALPYPTLDAVPFALSSSKL